MKKKTAIIVGDPDDFGNYSKEIVAIFVYLQERNYSSIDYRTFELDSHVKKMPWGDYDKIVCGLHAYERISKQLTALANTKVVIVVPVDFDRQEIPYKIRAANIVDDKLIHI